MRLTYISINYTLNLYKFYCILYFISLIYFIVSRGKVDEKATQLHAIASLKVLLDATKPHNGSSSSTTANHVTLSSQMSQETKLAVTDQPNGVATGLEDAGDAVSTARDDPVRTVEFDREKKSTPGQGWKLQICQLTQNFRRVSYRFYNYDCGSGVCNYVIMYSKLKQTWRERERERERE
ncbi:hypothetical protein RUM43_004252 [Polyplax serrata]|uniref:Uncharacterized protein n=1 Tax=Polyplax serrata TaxID=468196 RepID=A0AAN8SAP1_POLSC